MGSRVPPTLPSMAQSLHRRKSHDHNTSGNETPPTMRTTRNTSSRKVMIHLHALGWIHVGAEFRDVCVELLAPLLDVPSEGGHGGVGGREPEDVDGVGKERGKDIGPVDGREE